MKRLKVESHGDAAQRVVLTGGDEEPTYFRVCLPFGEVYLARLDDGSYWVHVIPCDDDVDGDDLVPGQFMGARLDRGDCHASEVDIGDFEHPTMYHAAIRIGRKFPPEGEWNVRKAK